MKLYKVVVTIELAVVAESAEEAEDSIRDHAHDWTDEIWIADFDTVEVLNMAQLDRSWHEAIPYGATENTCEWYLDKEGE